MHLQQFYLGCLAQASYLVGEGGEAAVVDPRRDVDEYLTEAEAHGLRIKYVVETHVHADFVSGHRELAARTGATIVMSRKAGARFPHLGVGEGDVLELGKLRLEVIETPGHTPESISILVREGPGTPRAVFTGDTLFIGDAGRPDLAGAQGASPQDMASLLYDSLHGKLLRLPNDVLVYPAHGAGSLCGRNLSKETVSTIGEQRRMNLALQPMSREEFVAMMTTDLPEVPPYFSHDVAINRAGAASLAELPAPAPLDPVAFRSRIAAGAIALDVRPAADFAAGHVEGSINIGLDGQFASWAGTMIPVDRPIVLVADSPEAAAEARMRLARTGLDNVEGYLDGGLDAWKAVGGEVRAFAFAAPAEIATRLNAAIPPQVLDVRRATEFASGHIENAVFLPLDRLAREIPDLDPARPLVVVCAGGYRASIACSVLESRGFRSLTNLAGGMDTWRSAGGAVTT